MKILFIGGTGNISSEISNLILERGKDELVLLNRGGAKNKDLPKGARFLTGDIHDEAAIKKLIANESFDVVADFIAFTPDHVERDYRLFKGKTKQYIFISSASAYQKPQALVPITESTPLVNPYWQYSRDKIACEDFLMKMVREEGFPATIIRPSHTYGDFMLPLPIAGWPTLKRMIEGKQVIIHGDGTSLWTLTHSKDFARAFVGLMGNVHTIGDAINITGDEWLTWNQIFKIYADILGVKLNAVHVSSDFLVATSSEDLEGPLCGDMMNNVIFDNAKLKKLIPGFAADIAFSEGIKMPIKNHLNNVDLQIENPAFDRWCDAVIAAQETAIESVRKALL
ncbi:MAG: SDR family oxidoreductase [Treponema sp.]|jgi:nucleoside-diphosphate-sugar epimerase|nr:SDR family oxidoreductase [Treponema sp.]